MPAPFVSLNARIHILPGAVARMPGHIASQIASPTAAISATARCMAALPAALRQHWLARPGGHVVISAGQHGFIPGQSPFRGRMLDDVAWLKLSHYSDRLHYLRPVGGLVAYLLGWGENAPAHPILKSWDPFASGVHTCFQAGYGLSIDAQQDVDAYLAEGIAAYLADRRALNLRDPGLEKLLSANVFAESTYHPAPPVSPSNVTAT